MTVFGAALPPRKCTFAEKITENPLTIFLASCIMSKLRNGSIAQPGEHLPYKQGVTGSSPVLSTNISGPVVQSVSTPACHAGGRRFESVPGRQFRYADMAQAVERVLGKDEVGGSSPPISSSCAANAAQFFIFTDYIHKIPRRHGTYRPAGFFIFY